MPIDLVAEYNKQGRNLVEEHSVQPTQERNLVMDVANEVVDITAGTVESLASIASGMVLWPISKAWGVSHLATGASAEYARKQEEKISGLAYQPRSRSGKGAVDIVGKGMDMLTYPARRAGEGATELLGPKVGYLTELAAELATFKGVGKIGKDAKVKLETKLSGLTPDEFKIVKEIQKAPKPRKPKKYKLDENYEKVKDTWHGKEDVSGHKAKIEGMVLENEIYEASGKNRKLAQKHNEAIQVYIDSKRAPEHLDKFYGELTKKQREIVDLSQNLPKEILKIAKKVEDAYQKTGIEALEKEVIRNTIDNYAARTWITPHESKINANIAQRFGTTTRHAKARKLKSISEGWSKGFQLFDGRATGNLVRYKKDIGRTIADREFVNELMKTKTVKGDPLLTAQHHKGYVRVNHPNFKKWDWAGRIKKGKVYGQNFFADSKGRLMERKELYAPKAQAKNLNNMLGQSALNEFPGIPTVTKYNAIVKSWILQSSLFHHQAFYRSYGFGVHGKTLHEMNPNIYKEGMKAIMESDPMVELGVKNGLTFFLQQDWQPNLLKQKTIFGKVLDQTKVTKATKDGFLKAREAYADFLFGKLGSGLKAKAFIIEMRKQVKKYPHENPDVMAKRVALLINDDFGGLHLKRMGRNPTLQHMFQLAALAPDWTESNVRTMAKMIKNRSGDPAELKLYRRFWGGIILKGAGLTAAANFMLAGGDMGDMIKSYDKAWKDGNLAWAKVNVTPIYKALGGESMERKYFPLLGHFLDMPKFAAHPIRSAKHKGSVLTKAGLEAVTGADWKGYQYTTIGELIDTKQLTKWGKGGSVDYDQLPSYILSQTIGNQPIQVQNFATWMNGEQDGFDAILKSIGVSISSTHSPKSKKLKTLSGLKE